MQAIPTVYRGIQMRSRLEAKWAAFFDLAKWSWEYEPVDFNGWIPDFVIRGQAEHPLLVEIKPIFQFDRTTAQKIERALKYIPTENAVPLHDQFEVVILGASLRYLEEHDVTSIGWVSDWWGGHEEAMWDDALPIYPGDDHPGQLGLIACVGSYADRISGYHDGDRGWAPLSQQDIETLWAKATNAVQWKAPR